MENTNVDEEIILFYMELRYNGATLLILSQVSDLEFKPFEHTL